MNGNRTKHEHFVVDIGKAGVLLIEALTQIFRPPFRWKLYIKQMEFIGNKSLSFGKMYCWAKCDSQNKEIIQEILETPGVISTCIIINEIRLEDVLRKKEVFDRNIIDPVWNLLFYIQQSDHQIFCKIQELA